MPEEVVLVDAEDGSSNEIEITPSLLQAYRDMFTRHTREIEAYCRKYGWAYLQASTAVPFEDLMLKMLRVEGWLR